jgi:hypothetical protein
VGWRFAQMAKWKGGFNDLARTERLPSNIGKRRFAAQHLVGDATKTVDVAATVQILFSSRLFWTHVLEGSNYESRHGQRLDLGVGDRLGNAEVRHDRMPSLKEDILRLDVTVDDAAGVSESERISHLTRDPEGILNRQLVLPAESIAEGLALNIWHHVVQEAAGFARIEQRQNVGVTETGRGLDLAEETVRTNGRGQVRVQDLDGEAP